MSIATLHRYVGLTVAFLGYASAGAVGVCALLELAHGVWPRGSSHALAAVGTYTVARWCERTEFQAVGSR